MKNVKNLGRIRKKIKTTVRFRKRINFEVF